MHAVSGKRHLHGWQASVFWGSVGFPSALYASIFRVPRPCGFPSRGTEFCIPLPLSEGSLSDASTPAASSGVIIDAEGRKQIRKSTVFILRQLVTRDFKLKYRRSVLGVVWSVLNPLLMMAVLTLVFSTMFRFDIENYPVYLILGMTLFTLMSDSTNAGMLSIIDSSALLKKVRIEKVVFPLEKVLFSLVNYLFSFIAVLGVMLFFHIAPTPSMLAFPLLLVYVFLFCTGVSLLLASLTVFFRDVIHLWGVVITAWNYLTPVFWPEAYLDNLAGGLQQVLLGVEHLNPMYYFISYLRQIMMYGTMPGLEFNLMCLLFAVVTFAVGLVVFRKTEHKCILYI